MMLENPNAKKKATIIAIIFSIIVSILGIVMLEYSSCARSTKYKVYKYAIQCVEDELKYPDSATYPSFSKTNVERDRELTIDLHVGHWSGNVKRSCEEAWVVRGSGTCENAFKMKMNYTFEVIVVIDDNGDFWCYECIIN